MLLRGWPERYRRVPGRLRELGRARRGQTGAPSDTLWSTASRWGGKVIPQATVEAAAAYSKQIWPTLPTIVNAPLGLFAGLNVLDGGDGSSGFHGNYPGKWAMSAAELRTYGTALLSQSYVCGFGMWECRSAYYDRADVKSAMADLSAKAQPRQDVVPPVT